LVWSRWKFFPKISNPKRPKTKFFFRFCTKIGANQNFRYNDFFIYKVFWGNFRWKFGFRNLGKVFLCGIWRFRLTILRILHLIYRNFLEISDNIKNEIFWNIFYFQNFRLFQILRWFGFCFQILDFVYKFWILFSNFRFCLQILDFVFKFWTFFKVCIFFVILVFFRNFGFFFWNFGFFLKFWIFWNFLDVCYFSILFRNLAFFLKF